MPTLNAAGKGLTSSQYMHVVGFVMNIYELEHGRRYHIRKNAKAILMRLISILAGVI